MANLTSLGIWEAINSPVVLTLLTVLISGLVAARVTAQWQLRSQVFQLRLEAAKQLVADYAEWMMGFTPSGRDTYRERSIKLANTLGWVRTLFRHDDREADQATSDFAKAMRVSNAAFNQTQAMPDEVDEQVRQAYARLMRLISARLNIPR